MRERRQEQEKMLAITMRKLEAADKRVEKLTGVLCFCKFVLFCLINVYWILYVRISMSRVNEMVDFTTLVDITVEDLG